jgi:hypothetical protein
MGGGIADAAGCHSLNDNDSYTREEIVTPERQAEIEALGSLSNEVQNNPNAIFKFVCEAKRGIRELMIELQQARQRAEVAEASSNWTPVEELLPEPDVRVLAVYSEGQRPIVIRAVHLPAKYAACYEEYEEAEYDEETDTLYFPGGWYEAIESAEYAYIGPMSGTVTHWQPLPALPSRV